MQVNQISGGVTIVKVGGSRPDLQQNVSVPNQQLQATAQPVSVQRQHPDLGGCWLNRQEVNRLVITRPRLVGDSRSTGRLHTSIGHRSMTRLNIGKLLFPLIVCYTHTKIGIKKGKFLPKMKMSPDKRHK